MKSARNKKRTKESELKRDAVAKPQAGMAAGVFGWLLPAVVVVATVFAFLPSLQNGFVNWDDDQMLLQNPRYRGLGWAQVRWMFTTFHMGHYQPLSWVTFGMDYLLWGMKPMGYHLTNLVLHAANALVFYFISLRLLALTRPGAGNNLFLRGAAAFAALFFAIHPLRVESVVWVTERRDVLSGLFFLGTILCYLRYAAQSGTGGARTGWMISALMIYGLSLLSKASGIVLPIVLLALDVYPLRRLTGGPGKWLAPGHRRVWWEKLPFLLLALVFGIVALRAQSESGALVSVEAHGSTIRVAQAFLGLNFYLWQTLFPLELSPLYHAPLGIDPFSAPFVISAVVVVTISAALFALRRRYPAGLTLWCYYLIVLFPVLGFTQSGPQFVANRYSYLSCLGWAVLMGAGLLYSWELRASKRIPRATLALVEGFAGAVVITLGVLTWEQTKVWRDSETLWRYTLATGQESNIVHTDLGVVLAEQGRWEEAIEHYQKALLLNPNDADAHNNLGNALAAQGQTEEAIKQYRQTLRLSPKHASAHSNLGLALAKRGQWEEGVESLREALRIDPNLAKAHYGLGLALALRGQTDEALSHYREAIKINPDLAIAHYELGLALAKRGQWEEAIAQYREVLRVKPTDAEAHTKLGAGLAKQGKFDESIKYLRKALELESSAAMRMETHFYLGITVAKQGRLEAAREHFEQALKISPEFVEAQHYLGRVWAAQGNLTKAIAYFRQAIRLEPEFAEAHQSLGEALEEQGSRDEAAKEYQIALQLFKSRRQAPDGR